MPRRRRNRHRRTAPSAARVRLSPRDRVTTSVAPPTLTSWTSHRRSAFAPHDERRVTAPSTRRRRGGSAPVAASCSGCRGEDDRAGDGGGGQDEGATNADHAESSDEPSHSSTIHTRSCANSVLKIDARVLLADQKESCVVSTSGVRSPAAIGWPSVAVLHGHHWAESVVRRHWLHASSSGSAVYSWMPKPGDAGREGGEMAC